MQKGTSWSVGLGCFPFDFPRGSSIDLGDTRSHRAGLGEERGETAPRTELLQKEHLSPNKLAHSLHFQCPTHLLVLTSTPSVLLLPSVKLAGLRQLTGFPHGARFNTGAKLPHPSEPAGTVKAGEGQVS
ncbi:unnamed protein product [Boreogadus saida]